MLGIVEIDADDRIVARIVFDPDDIDAAIEELDARYLAGEAAPYAHTWSVITRFNAAFNRREIPPTTDWVTIDHRRVITADTVICPHYIRAKFGTSRQTSTSTSKPCIASASSERSSPETDDGTSQEGFDAEWRMISSLTVEGDQVKPL